MPMTSARAGSWPCPASSRRPAILHMPVGQGGFSLIEVMVSVLIMGVGLLGIAAMQATALRNAQSSLESSQAVIQSYAILDAMRANSSNASSYSLGSVSGSTVTAECAVPTDTDTLANADLREWLLSLKNTMGSGDDDSTTCGAISCQVTSTESVCTVAVQWDDSRGSDGGDGDEGAGGSTRQVVTVSTL